MAMARRETVVNGEEGLFHCVSRCVRRAFLCGEDRFTGRSFDHRKAWVQNRLALLASVFGIEVCAFAVMSNHLHVVIRTRPDWVKNWTEKEVAYRWLTLFPPRRDSLGRPFPPSEGEMSGLAEQPGKVEELRNRLGGISWFMRCLNENIARRANREDDCKGRFWEGRYYCQALLDDSALLACMAYVDLNPVRAGAAASPEESLFTSAYLRIASPKADENVASNSIKMEHGGSPRGKQAISAENGANSLDRWLCPIQDDGDGDGRRRGLLDISRDDYLNLLAWTARRFREAAPAPLPEKLGSIMTRLGIEQDNWPDLAGNYGGLFFRAAGKTEALTAAAARVGREWLHGLRASRKYFLPA
ncbi:MAG: hypothetical protein V1816_23940 [Pseudomonadota bacterium]